VEEDLFQPFVNRALRRMIILGCRRGCRRLYNDKLHNLFSVIKIFVSENIRKDETENGTRSEIRNRQ